MKGILHMFPLVVALIGLVFPVPTNSQSVILFIGDGCGINSISLAELVEHGTEGRSAYLGMPYKAIAHTLNVFDEVTDSAAAATCIATGYKTSNGRIGRDHEGEDLRTIIDAYQKRGLRTGVIAKSHLTHATPGSFLAHADDRDSYVEIASGIARSGVDILLGGGKTNQFMGTVIEDMKAQGYTYVTSRKQLKDLPRQCKQLPILGVFGGEDGFLPFYNVWDPNGEDPSLLDMTTAALDYFEACGSTAKNDSSGDFFLMIEGSMIDTGNHHKNAEEAILEAIEFDNTMKYVLKRYAGSERVTVMVTADHETGGITSMKTDGVDLNTLPKPKEGLSFADNQERRKKRLGVMEVSYIDNTHTFSPILVAAEGAEAHQISGIKHTSNIYEAMLRIMGKESNTVRRDTDEDDPGTIRPPPVDPVDPVVPANNEKTLMFVLGLFVGIVFIILIGGIVGVSLHCSRKKKRQGILGANGGSGTSYSPHGVYLDAGLGNDLGFETDKIK